MTKNRRNSIKQAAQNEFSRLGFAGGRISRIASAAGANKQLIFYYFGSKEKLYKLLLEEAVGEILRGSRGDSLDR